MDLGRHPTSLCRAGCVQQQTGMQELFSNRFCVLLFVAPLAAWVPHAQATINPYVTCQQCNAVPMGCAITITSFTLRSLQCDLQCKLHGPSTVSTHVKQFTQCFLCLTQAFRGLECVKQEQHNAYCWGCMPHVMQPYHRRSGHRARGDQWPVRCRPVAACGGQSYSVLLL
jgi:hypothetical protein